MNILERFLKEIEVRHTKTYANKLYNEHPNRDNMYGLKKMLEVYGVKTLGVRIDSKDLSCLNFPCILHIHGSAFVIATDCGKEHITFYMHDKKTIISNEKFKNIWTGNALVISETTEAFEPNYRKHFQEKIISDIKTCSIPFILFFAAILGIVLNSRAINIYSAITILLSSAGVVICSLLMQKQLFGISHFGDRICSMFHHADCTSILDGKKAKIFGISWSEIGLGYFVANILLLSLYLESVYTVAIINWLAMFYGIWSIYYQWHVAKNWCVLCVIVQIIIWIMGIIAGVYYYLNPLELNLISGLFSCITFSICIMAVHYAASSHTMEKERIMNIQKYRALIAKTTIARTLLKSSNYYETSQEDSSIQFGNPNANIRVSILSNPHCNPCARMHNIVEELIDSCGNKICIQYIFSYFHGMDDSSRYLISCYDRNNISKTREIYSKWYAGEKKQFKEIIGNNVDSIHSEKVEEEWQRHKSWCARTGLSATPTILINGYKLPEEYTRNDIGLLIDSLDDMI